MLSCTPSENACLVILSNEYFNHFMPCTLKLDTKVKGSMVFRTLTSPGMSHPSPARVLLMGRRDTEFHGSHWPRLAYLFRILQQLLMVEMIFVFEQPQ